MKKFWLFSCLVLLAGSLAAAGCSRSSGTYVVLDLRGSLSNIRSIAVDLDMGGQKANAVFTAPVASTITLPTDAILQIQHGSGMLYVTATAKAVDQQVLGTGTGSGPVVAGETKHITVQFGGSEGDAGVFDGSDGPGGSSGDAPVDHFGPEGSGGFGGSSGGFGGSGGMGGFGGSGGMGGLGGSIGAAGSSGAGGQAQDAAPDRANGGTGGGAGGGTGMATIVSEPSSLPFGNVFLNSTSAPQTTTIRNVGSAAAPALTVKAPPPNSSFAVKTDTCSGRTLAPSDVCTVSVVFSPSSLGTASATLSVVAGSGSRTDITLTGSGLGSSTGLTLQPTEAPFNVVDVGSSGNVTFTVNNTGSSSASMLLVSNSSGPAFRITADQCSNRALAAQTSCTFVVTFAPNAVGPASGSVMVTSPGETTPLTASLAGNGRDYVTLTVKLSGGPDFRYYNPMAPVNDRSLVTYYGDASLTANITSSHSLTFAYKAWQWVGSTGKVPEFDSSYSLNYHWSATKQLGFDLGGKFQEADFTRGNDLAGSAPSWRDDGFYSISAGVSYAFTPHLNTSLTYAYNMGRDLLDNYHQVPALANTSSYREFNDQQVSLAVQFKF